MVVGLTCGTLFYVGCGDERQCGEPATHWLDGDDGYPLCAECADKAHPSRIAPLEICICPRCGELHQIPSHEVIGNKKCDNCGVWFPSDRTRVTLVIKELVDLITGTNLHTGVAHIMTRGGGDEALLCGASLSLVGHQVVVQRLDQVTEVCLDCKEYMTQVPVVPIGKGRKKG